MPDAATNIQTKPTVIPCFRDNYFALIENSEGTNMFRHWYCTVNGAKEDVMRDGNFSCALYVTGILKMLGLVDEVQITVHRAVSALERSGWQRIDGPRRGAIVVWDTQPSQKEEAWVSTAAKHLGFCLGENTAISNRDEAHAPIRHPLDYRPVLFCLWHPKLDGKE
ncbi:MAG: hypothetical protein KGJ13_05980 [Patescibacteria group bacterium]|nr:hypothetical protein [Patescibacteria group bacterium]